MSRPLFLRQVQPIINSSVASSTPAPKTFLLMNLKSNRGEESSMVLDKVTFSTTWRFSRNIRRDSAGEGWGGGILTLETYSLEEENERGEVWFRRFSGRLAVPNHVRHALRNL